MRVTFYHRRPHADNFSIERVFQDVRQALPPNIRYRVAVSHFESRGLWKRVYNVIEAAFRQGDVNHITGDVHFLALLLDKKRTLITIHDCVSLERLKGWRKKIFFFFWYWLPEKRSSLITVVSESTKQELLRYLRCPPGKIRVVHDCVSDDFKPVLSPFNAIKPVVLQVGTGKNKNLLRVAAALKGISCHLRIVGKLSDAQIATMKAYQIEYSSVAGISEKEMLREYQRSDMLIFASTYEGFGLPILEAQATGRPVVTSNIMSMPEVAGDAACLVDPFDVTSIREGILKIIHDMAYRDELVRRGFENIVRFRAETISNNYVEIYNELLKGK